MPRKLIKLRMPRERAKNHHLLSDLKIQQDQQQWVQHRQRPSTKSGLRGWWSMIPSWLLTALGLLLVLLAWIWAASSSEAQYGLVPTPQATAATLFDFLTQRLFWNDLSVSIYRMSLGFLVSIAIGIPAGLGIGLSRKLSAMFEGIINSFKYTPVTAFIPLSIILFGIGDFQKLVMIFLGTGPYMAALVADAVRSTRSEYVDGALTLGASRMQVITRVVLPSVAPRVWQAARIALGIAWTYLITAELVGAENGLGRLLIRAERFFNVKELYAGVIIIGTIGWLSDVIFRVIYVRLFRWAVLLNKKQG